TQVSEALSADALLIEACLRRPWPGNVRELLGEARRAGHAAVDQKRTVVDRLDLGTAAGLRLGAGPAPGPAPTRVTPAPTPARGDAFPSSEHIEQTLRRLDGNVTRAAQELGLHRNQLRRWLARKDG